MEISKKKGKNMSKKATKLNKRLKRIERTLSLIDPVNILKHEIRVINPNWLVYKISYSKSSIIVTDNTDNSIKCSRSGNTNYYVDNYVTTMNDFDRITELVQTFFRKYLA